MIFLIGSYVYFSQVLHEPDKDVYPPAGPHRPVSARRHPAATRGFPDPEYELCGLYPRCLRGLQVPGSE